MRLRCLASAAAGAAAVFLAACGGGGVLAVAGFLGTGGGQWFPDADANPGNGYQLLANCAGGSPCNLSIDAPTWSFASTPSYSLTANGGPANCNNASGTVNGRRVDIPGCFTGSYVSVNELRSDDGNTVFFYDFFPQLTGSVWNDLNTARRYEFFSEQSGCEISDAGRRPFSATVVTSNYAVQAFPPANEPLRPRTFISSLAVTNGPTFTGEFVGASGLRLNSAGGSAELQRSSQSAGTTC